MGRRKKVFRSGGIESKRVKWGILLCGCIFLLLGVLKNEYKKNDLTNWSDSYIGLKEATTMLSFMPYTEDDWIKLLDFSEDRELKYVDLKEILEHLGVSKYVTYTKKGDSKIVSRKVWNEIYAQLLGLLDTDGSVTETTCLIFDTDAENQTVTTQDGNYTTEVSADFFQEKEAYVCYIYNGNIIGMKQDSDMEAVISNAFIKGIADKKVEFLFAGNSYEFALKDEVEDLSGIVCDLHWSEGEIIEIDKKQETISGNLLTVDDEKIEIDGYGQLKRAKNMPIYKTYGTIEEKSLSDIVIGNMDVTYVVAGDEVCAILLNQPADLANIRVLLLNDGDVYRDGVYITCDGSFQITYGETVSSFDAGTLFDASTVLTAVGEGYVQVDSSGDGELYLADSAGKRISYGYDGDFEIRRYDSGYVVINDVSIENYLYQVVTSEMPASYELEALKAQAVCARSYAYRQLLQGAYAQYGAHVDDSTNYQVYNKQEHSDIAKTAVDDTCGEIMECNGEIIEAFYFSTSCGMTEDGSVWNSAASDAYPFLKAVRVSSDSADLNLSDETAFYNYITGTDDTCFDAFAHYFRWNAAAKITDAGAEDIEQVIKSRKSVNSDNILIYDSAGNLADDMDDMGNLVSMQTKIRGTGGAVLDLTLNYENGRVEILTEYNIRAVLGCLVDTVNLCDGTTQENSSLLPSAYFSLVYDENTGSYTLYGGGYGHGVGMSQNGAQGMAKQGYGYKDILNFFFQNITIQLKG